jgi:hypothetical protein
MKKISIFDWQYVPETKKLWLIDLWSKDCQAPKLANGMEAALTKVLLAENLEPKDIHQITYQDTDGEWAEVIIDECINKVVTKVIFV